MKAAPPRFPIEERAAALIIGWYSIRFPSAICPFPTSEMTLRKAWVNGRRRAVKPGLKVNWENALKWASRGAR